MLDIKITKTTHPKQKPADETKLGFGKKFSDHMFVMNYTEGKGWFDPRIVPYGSFELDPATVVFHYAQELFEGMKAFSCSAPTATPIALWMAAIVWAFLPSPLRILSRP